ncbi:MAG TPA: hypothetical protein V6C86_17605 [Oculatellaceae cyanobacterium]
MSEIFLEPFGPEDFGMMRRFRIDSNSLVTEDKFDVENWDGCAGYAKYEWFGVFPPKLQFVALYLEEHDIKLRIGDEVFVVDSEIHCSRHHLWWTFSGLCQFTISKQGEALATFRYWASRQIGLGVNSSLSF